MYACFPLVLLIDCQAIWAFSLALDFDSKNQNYIKLALVQLSGVVDKDVEGQGDHEDQEEGESSSSADRDGLEVPGEVGPL